MLPAKEINELFVVLWHCQNQNDVILGWIIILLPLIFWAGKSDSNSLSTSYTTWCCNYVVYRSFIALLVFQVLVSNLFLPRKIYAAKLTASALLTSPGEMPTSIFKTIRQAGKKKKKRGSELYGWFTFTLHTHCDIFWVVWCTYCEIAQLIFWGRKRKAKQELLMYLVFQGT